MKSVLVNWEVATTEKMSGWYSSSAVPSAFDNMETVKYQSLGFLVNSDEKSIVLASSLQGDNFGELFRIPKCNISSIQEVFTEMSNNAMVKQATSTSAENTSTSKSIIDNMQEDVYTTESLLWEKENLTELPTIFHGVEVEKFIKMYPIMTTKELSTHFDVTTQVVKVLSSILVRLDKLKRKEKGNKRFNMPTTTATIKVIKNKDVEVVPVSDISFDENMSCEDRAKNDLKGVVDKYYKINLYSFYRDFVKGLGRTALSEKYNISKGQVDAVICKLKYKKYIDQSILGKRKQNQRKDRLRKRNNAKTVVASKKRVKMQVPTKTAVTAMMSNSNSNTNSESTSASTSTSIQSKVKSHFGTTKIRANVNSLNKKFIEENFVKDFYKNSYKGLSDIYGLSLGKVQYLVKKLRRQGSIGHKLSIR